METYYAEEVAEMRHMTLTIAAAGGRVDQPLRPTRMFLADLLNEPDDSIGGDPRTSRAAMEAQRRAEQEFGGPAR